MVRSVLSLAAIASSNPKQVYLQVESSLREGASKRPSDTESSETGAPKKLKETEGVLSDTGSGESGGPSGIGNLSGAKSRSGSAYSLMSVDDNLREEIEKRDFQKILECVQKQPECQPKKVKIENKDSEGNDDYKWEDQVPDSCFEEAPEPLEAGGTATIQRLKLSEDVAERCKVGVFTFIGKDLEHAKFELEFYEKWRSIVLADPNQNTGLKKISPFLPSFLGVLNYHPQGVNGQTRRLLVIQNMFYGMDKNSALLLDIKIGHPTAESGWKGKNGTYKNDIVDWISTSKDHGFRLEGMSGYKREEVKKIFKRIPEKLEKIRMQSVPFDEWWSAVVTDYGKNKLFTTSIAEKLGEYYEVLEAIKTPQKWIGSSIGIVIDRSNNFLLLAFDFGRSELRTEEEWKNLEEKTLKFKNWVAWWTRYKDGIKNLRDKFGEFSKPSGENNRSESENPSLIRSFSSTTHASNRKEVDRKRTQSGNVPPTRFERLLSNLRSRTRSEGNEDQNNH